MNVEQNNSDFVLDGDVLIEEDGDDVPHVIADLLALGVGAHGQVLLNLAQFVNVALLINSCVEVTARFIARAQKA